MKLKALRRAVCDAFEAHSKAAGGKADVEAARATFKKKLKKIEGVVNDDGDVRFAKA